MQILTFVDPYDLWLAAIEVPEPTPCKALTGKGVECPGKGQSGQGYCSKHYEKATGQKWAAPDFSKTATGIQVLYEGERLPIAMAVAYLKLGRKLNEDETFWLINGDDLDFNPDNIQILPRKIFTEARKLAHPVGEPMRWVGEGAMAAYNPTSVRLPPALIDFLDSEAARTGLSRSAALEHYLLEGVKKGDRVQSKGDKVQAALEHVTGA